MTYERADMPGEVALVLCLLSRVPAKVCVLSRSQQGIVTAGQPSVLYYASNILQVLSCLGTL